MTARAHGAFSRHGGRLTAAAAAFPDAPSPWIDLSTGINPRGWRGARATPRALRRLPDPAAVAELEAVASRAFGVAETGAVAAVPGAEAALRLVPRLTGARSVAIAAPTYGGHAEAWRASGVEPSLVAEPGGSDADAVIVVNPNNPDGRQWAPADLLALAARQSARAGWLIVDESFAEATPGTSVAGAAATTPGLIVLRSFGKFFGLPGARLGFVVASPAVAGQTRAAFGDWPVGADAIALGLSAYADEAWAQRERAWLGAEADKLDRLLDRAGFDILGGTPLFRLTRSPDAAERFTALAEAGLLVRPFEEQPQWLRFGLPGSASTWRRLDAALSRFRP